jgi:hypothetical protein
MYVNVFHITPAGGSMPPDVVNTVVKWSHGVPDAGICVWVPLPNLAPLAASFKDIVAIRVSPLPSPVEGNGGGAVLGPLVPTNFGPAINMMASSNLLLGGDFKPPPGFVGCVGDDKLANIRDLSDDDSFKTPPPLLRQKAQMGGGLLALG